MNRVLPGLLMAAAWLLLSFGPAALMGLVLLQLEIGRASCRERV